MFIDQIKIYARAGHGGKGCVAFHREAYVPKGGPSGGNGGHGGDVILEASHDLNNLIGQYYQPRLIAQDGKCGLGKGCDGLAGKDIIIKVPCGTLIWKLPSTTPPTYPVEAEETEETEKTDDEAEEISEELPPMMLSTGKRPVIRHSGDARGVEMDLSKEPDSFAAEKATDHGKKGELVADLTTHGQRYVLCKAGRGGLGNRNFATSVRQTPRFAQPGEPGEEGDYFFELRIMAEIGIVGYPNAGKSTLLAAISHARPKIAPYPFTTLTPQIGIVEYPDWHRLTVCDVPGLIEGAHLNVGLGHAFLRHIARCKVLVLLLDMAGTDNRLPWDDYKQLLKELEYYDPALLDRPRLVVANKMDEPASEKMLKQFKTKFKKLSVLPISAAFGEGMEKFRETIRKAVAAADKR